MSSNKANRPSPSDSATMYRVGYQMTGNDGHTWEVRKDSNGVQRWSRALTYTNKIQQVVQPHIVLKANKAATNAAYGSAQETTSQPSTKPHIFLFLISILINLNYYM